MNVHLDSFTDTRMLTNHSGSTAWSVSWKSYSVDCWRGTWLWIRVSDLVTGCLGGCSRISRGLSWGPAPLLMRSQGSKPLYEVTKTISFSFSIRIKNPLRQSSYWFALQQENIHTLRKKTKKQKTQKSCILWKIEGREHIMLVIWGLFRGVLYFTDSKSP